MKKIILPAILLATLIAPSITQAQNSPSLFDGKTLKGWHKLAGAADYKVENGAIVGTTVLNSGNTFLVTDKEYGDFVLELDTKIESKLSNSGVQTRSHFDPAGHEGKGLVYGRQFEIDPSDRKWSGGIYDEGRRDWLYPLDLHEKAKDIFKVDVPVELQAPVVEDFTMVFQSAAYGTDLVMAWDNVKTTLRIRTTQ